MSKIKGIAKKRRALRARDGDYCWLCDIRMVFKFDTKKKDRAKQINWFTSIDHVLELRNGGKHGMENLKLAHQLCNRLREKCYSKDELACLLYRPDLQKILREKRSHEC